MMSLDVGAPRLRKPRLHDRLFTSTRRGLGALRPDVAEALASRHVATLFGVV